MCYKSPGPRCSHHAYKTFLKLKKQYKRNPSEETFERARHAWEEYLKTPAGFKKLEKQMESANAMERISAESKLEINRIERARALRALKVQEDEGIPVYYPKQFVDQALESSLSWKGKKPSWWGEYQNEARSYAIPSEPEILDVIDTPVGKVAVVWDQVSMSSNDKYPMLEGGLQISRLSFRSFKNNEVVAYIAATQMNDESYERSFKNDLISPLRRKWSSNLVDCEEPSVSQNEEYRKAWLVAHRQDGLGIQRNGENIPAYELKEQHIPDDMDQVKQDLQRFVDKHAEESQRVRDYYKTPYVDFSRVVDPKLKGLGIGATAYVYTARKLATQGKVLRGSGLQSDEAKTTWENMKKHLPNNVKMINLVDPYNQKKAQYPTLDFR